jgi:hypothetical protein
MLNNTQITPKNVNALCKTIPRNTLSRLASNQSENSKQWQQVTKQLNTNCSRAERLSKTPNLNNALLRNIPEDFQYISGPNLNLNLQEQVGSTSQEFSLDNLLISNVTSSYNQLQSLLNEKGLKINVNY